jgi:hypothetical protein
MAATSALPVNYGQPPQAPGTTVYDSNGNVIPPSLQNQSPTLTVAQTTFAAKWNNFSFLEHTILEFILGFGLLTSILVFIVLFMRLAMVSFATPKMKVHLMRDLMIAAVVTMLLGSVNIVYYAIFGITGLFPH